MEPTNPVRPSTTSSAAAAPAQATDNNNNTKIEPSDGPVMEKLLEGQRKDDNDESRVGAFPSQMPRLRGLQKNREDALEALGGGKRTTTNATTDVLAHSQQQELQKKPASSQRTNESPGNHPKQQEDMQIDVMDIVRKRAIMANEEETELNHQKILSMPQPPTFGGSEHHHLRDQAPPPSHDSTTHTAVAGAFAGVPGEGLYRRDNIRFSHVGIRHPPLPEDEEGIASINSSRMVGGGGDNDPIQPMSTAAAAGNGIQLAFGDDALAEALPVEDHEHPRADVEAKPYDMEAANRKKSEEAKRQKKFFLVLASVFFCIVVGVIFGVVFHNQNMDSKTTTLPTLAPSTTAPTDSLSPAPTGALDLLREDLPENTLESLGTYGTPQQKAWDWLIDKC